MLIAVKPFKRIHWTNGDGIDGNLPKEVNMFSLWVAKCLRCLSSYKKQWIQSPKSGNCVSLSMNSQVSSLSFRLHCTPPLDFSFAFPSWLANEWKCHADWHSFRMVSFGSLARLIESRSDWAWPQIVHPKQQQQQKNHQPLCGWAVKWDCFLD